MNLTLEGGVEFVKLLKSSLNRENEIVCGICPPFVFLRDICRVLESSGIFVAAQNNHSDKKIRQILFDVAITSCYLNIARQIVVVIKNLPFGSYYKLKYYPMEAREQFKFTSDLSERGRLALQEAGINMLCAPVAVDWHI